MNNLSHALTERSPSKRSPIPARALYILLSLFLLGFAVSVFILASVQNALFFASFLCISLFISAFLLWNSCLWSSHGALLLFLAGVPDSDLQLAADGQLVKFTGVASCGALSLESSYEKIPRCVYTSTLLYEYLGFRSKSQGCLKWRLAYSERLATDFYVTDVKSGLRAIVRAGYDSKVTPLICETTLVKTARSRVLSSYLRKWLSERNLLAEDRLLRLEEGYIKEGSFVTVMGTLCRTDGVLMIVQPPEPISVGCLCSKCLLPNDVDGLILALCDSSSMETPCNSQETEP